MSKKRRKSSRKKTGQKPPQFLSVQELLDQARYDEALNKVKSLQDAPQEKRKAALAETYFRRALRYPENRLNDLKRAVENRPDDALYAYHLGLEHHRRQDYAQAMACYQNALQHDPDFERVYPLLALAYQALDQDPADSPGWQALTSNQRARLEAARQTGNPLLQGLQAYQQADWEAARAQLAAIAQGDDYSEQALALAHDYLGRIAQQHDQPDQALKHWRQAYQLGRRDETFMENLALAYTLQAEALIDQKQTEAALKLVKEIAPTFPDHPRLPDIYAHLLLEAGYHKARTGDWRAALRLWKQAPDNAAAEVTRRLAANLALAYEKQEDWFQAAEMWRDFARRRARKEGSPGWLSPAQVSRLWSRISNLYMRAGEPDEAITTLQTALKYDADNLELNLQLVRRYAEADRLEAALNHIGRVQKKHPVDLELHVLKAELAEAYYGTWFWQIRATINAWHDLLDVASQSGDEDGPFYAQLAQESLETFYYEHVEQLLGFFNDIQGAMSMVEQAMTKMPDSNFMQALYVYVLLNKHTRWTPKISKAIEQIDLSDTRTLMSLLDFLHRTGQGQRADEVLAQADAEHALDSDFYRTLAINCLESGLDGLAEDYADIALARAPDDEARRATLFAMAMTYGSRGDIQKADAMADDLLAEVPGYGPAFIIKTMINLTGGKKSDAQRYAQQAEKWAKEENHLEFLNLAQTLRNLLSQPLSPFSPSIMLPDIDDLDDDFFDDYHPG